MKHSIFTYLLLCITPLAWGQVGIGTTTPTEKAALEISSQINGAGEYRGFMPPKVPTVAARNSIMPTAADVGLMVFVEDESCLDIWNGNSWENVKCLNTAAFTNYFQNFDLNTNWGYITDVPFFNNGNAGFYGITTNTQFGFNVITTMTNNFLGILDLDDTESGNGTANFATITFNTINVSGATNGVNVAFKYQFFEYDGGDDAFYRLIIDNVPQPEIQLINGGGNNSASGTVSVNVPAGTITVSLVLRIKQNGQGDYAGLDNFALTAL